MLYRNICRHCKCPHNAHDVSQVDCVDVYSRLGLDPPPDTHTQADDMAFKLGYSWIPPGLSAGKVTLLRALDGLQEELGKNFLLQMYSPGGSIGTGQYQST